MLIIVLSKGQGKIDVLYCWILRSLKKTNVVQKYIVKNSLAVKKKEKEQTYFNSCDNEMTKGHRIDCIIISILKDG